MTTERSQSREMSEGAKALLNRLSEEYKILQDKVDRIGAFRFTIKGWSVTLVAAGVVSIAANRQVPPLVLFALWVFVLLFWTVENQQVSISRRYVRRIYQLERDFHYLALKTYQEPGLVSRLGRSPQIGDSFREPHRPSSASHPVVLRAKRFATVDALFYLVQCAVILAAYAALAGRSSQDAQPQPRVTIIDTDKPRSTR